MLVKSIFYYVRNNIPLTKYNFLDFLQEYVLLLSRESKKSMGVFNNRPTNKWLSSFSPYSNLEIEHLHLNEDKRI